MPDAPEKPFDPAAIARDKEAKKNSRPYRGVHPTVTVYDFDHLKGDYHTQRQVDREAEEIKGGFRKWVPAAEGAPAHWLIKQGDEWVQPSPDYPAPKIVRLY